MINDLRLKNEKLPNIPKAYQKGWVEFYKLKFKVTTDVLIPRPETELLVDEVLSFYNLYPKSYTLIDLGTGSGNIAISLAKNLDLHSPADKVAIIATDISTKALKIARKNAKLHGVMDKIKFIKSNLLSDINYTLPPTTHNLIIVANLPYIPSARIPYLDPSVKDFEPKVALNGGEDGFKLYRKLFQQIKNLHLKINLLIAEIDYTHGELAALEGNKYFPHCLVEVKKDLAHQQRILKITG